MENGIAPNGNAVTNGSRASDPVLETLLSQSPQAAVAVPAGLNAHQMSKERQRARNQVATAEKKVETLESRLKQIEVYPVASAPTDNVVALSQEHGGVQFALMEAMKAWEQAVAYSEALGVK